MRCPYCSKEFKTWKSVYPHMASCTKNTGEYFVHSELGPIHYTKILEYNGIIPLTNALKSFRRRGFDIPNIRRAWSREECIQAIHDFCVENGRIPASTDFENSGSKYPSRSTVSRLFGTWNKAIEAAGFEPEYIGRGWSREECIQAIHDFCVENGRIPQYRDFNKTDGKYPSCTTVSKLFGSWNVGIEAAGFESKNIGRDWSCEECIQAIHDFWAEHGCIPQYRDFSKTDGKYPSSLTVSKLFGSWNVAIEAAGYTPNIQNGLGISTYGKDGQVYRSKAEATFCDNYLFEQYDY